MNIGNSVSSLLKNNASLTELMKSWVQNKGKIWQRQSIAVEDVKENKWNEENSLSNATK